MKTYILNLMMPKTNIDQSTLQGKYLMVGANTGNNIFMESVKSQLNYVKEISVYDYDNVEDDAVVVIPCSNFIMHGGNNSFYENIIKFIDNTKCNIAVIGLGAQSSKIFKNPKLLVTFGLNRIKKECFKKLSLRCKSMGIRGEFTAKCLELMGIENYTIIGCPSFYSFFDGQYPAKQIPFNNKNVMSFSPASAEKTKLFEKGMLFNSIWVKQSIDEECDYYDKNDVNRMLPGVDYSKISKFIEYDKTSKLFFTEKEWNDFYENNEISFAFGTRFHGNMEALRNGVPTLWIAHDSRTSELINYLHLPCIDMQTAIKVQSIEELYKLCDMSGVRNNYSDLCQKYIEFLNFNFIDHKFKF